MQSNTMHEPFVRVVKRGEMPMKKKVFVRLAAVALASLGAAVVAMKEPRGGAQP